MLLLFGIVLTMALTISSLNTNGKKWIDSTSEDLKAKQIENLRAIVNAKSTNVKVFFFEVFFEVIF
jgi:hypothetical protein